MQWRQRRQESKSETEKNGGRLRTGRERKRERERERERERKRTQRRGERSGERKSRKVN